MINKTQNLQRCSISIKPYLMGLLIEGRTAMRLFSMKSTLSVLAISLALSGAGFVGGALLSQTNQASGVTVTPSNCLYKPPPPGVINWSNCWFRNANLEGGSLISANLTSAYLMGASMAVSDLTGANLNLANMINANLTSANLTNANLTSANLTSANLTHANLTHANLNLANLTSANLTNANLVLANLTGANLTWANLTGANLNLANLTGANLTNATCPNGFRKGTLGANC